MKKEQLKYFVTNISMIKFKTYGQIREESVINNVTLPETMDV